MHPVSRPLVSVDFQPNQPGFYDLSWVYENCCKIRNPEFRLDDCCFTAWRTLEEFVRSHPKYLPEMPASPQIKQQNIDTYKNQFCELVTAYNKSIYFDHLGYLVPETRHAWQKLLDFTREHKEFSSCLPDSPEDKQRTMNDTLHLHPFQYANRYVSNHPDDLYSQ